MPTASFKKTELRDLVDGSETEELKVVSDNIVDTGRWSIHHKLLFMEKVTGKLYQINYSRAATEQQDERPFEYEADQIICTEMRAVEKTVVVYEPA